MAEFANGVSVWQVRKQFPMLQKEMHGKPFVYLDTAATSQKPRSVIEAVCKFYAEEYATVHRSVYDFASHATEKYHAVRHQVREFINASCVEEIIFTRGTTDAINLVASSFGKVCLMPGDEILITEMEHHSNIVPWQIICKEKGASLRVLPMNDQGELRMDLLDSLLTHKTKLVAVAHIANTTGSVNPIEEMITKAHAKGAKVLIDGAQSIAHRPVDVQKLKADFFAFSGHKAYGPTGIGVLYGKKSLLESLPPYQGGGDMVERVSFANTTYAPLPMKFEAGTPMIAEVIGLGAAISFIDSLGREQIALWEQSLLCYATEKLQQVKGLRIIGNAKEKGGIISFVIEDLHPLDLGTLLDLRGIAIRSGKMCAEPTLDFFRLPSMLRISFAVHTTFEEIDLFVDALQEAILLLRPSLSY